jgi:hypothetical protein
MASRNCKSVSNRILGPDVTWRTALRAGLGLFGELWPAHWYRKQFSLVLAIAGTNILERFVQKSFGFLIRCACGLIIDLFEIGFEFVSGFPANFVRGRVMRGEGHNGDVFIILERTTEFGLKGGAFGV